MKNLLVILESAFGCMCQDLGVRIWGLSVKEVGIKMSKLIGWVNLCQALGVGVWDLLGKEEEINPIYFWGWL